MRINISKSQVICPLLQYFIKTNNSIAYFHNNNHFDQVTAGSSCLVYFVWNRMQIINLYLEKHILKLSPIIWLKEFNKQKQLKNFLKQITKTFLSSFRATSMKNPKMSRFLQ